jgi:hypothetical protein
LIEPPISGAGPAPPVFLDHVGTGGDGAAIHDQNGAQQLLAQLKRSCAPDGLLLILRHRDYPLRVPIPKNAFQGLRDVGQLQASDVRKEMPIFVVARDQTIVWNLGG